MTTYRVREIPSIGELATKFADEDVYRKRISENTWLTALPDMVSVTLHKTTIVTLSTATGEITLNSGGYHTVTTKQRMNVLLNAHGIRVYQKDFQLYVEIQRGGNQPNEILPFEDGMVV